MGSEPNRVNPMPTPTPPSRNTQIEDESVTKSRRYKKEVERLEKRVKIGRAVVVKAFTEVNAYSGRIIENAGIGGILPRLSKSRYDFAKMPNSSVKKCRITLEVIED